MHRTFFTLSFTIIMLFLSTSVFAQGSFITSTPDQDESETTEPTAEEDSSSSSGAFQTDGNSSGSSSSSPFATNTPLPPTSTPTPSPTPSETPSPTSTPTSTPTPIPLGPVVYPDDINSLTGLPYPDEEARARRNLIVKISNFPPIVRPQSGVNKADVVFEYEAEGGVTRFAAIFRSQLPEIVGSIRSARLMDMELIVMYNALLAYSGTSEPIQRMLWEQPYKWQLLSPLHGNNCEDAGFCRQDLPGRDFEHTLFGDPVKMYEIATKQNVNTGYKARGFSFDEEPAEGGEVANDVFIDWYGQTDARWIYDEESGKYLRYTDGVPHFDKLDGEQLWADNLIIIEVPHARRPDLFPEGSNYESIEVQLWDTGRALVARDGLSWRGYWERANKEPSSALQVKFSNSDPIPLKPGKTWVSVVRSLGDFVISEERSDMVGTATQIALSATPTPTPSVTPTATSQ